MYVYVTVWKYYMKNDFEYGEEGIYVMDIRCSVIKSSSNIDVCALLEQEAICSYPFPVANISEVLPYRVTALMSTPFSALAGQTAREAHTSAVPSHPITSTSAPLSRSSRTICPCPSREVHTSAVSLPQPAPLVSAPFSSSSRTICSFPVPEAPASAVQ